MKVDPRTFALVKQRLDEAERNIQYVRQALDVDEASEQGIEIQETDEGASGGERVIEGVFDGQNMQGNDGNEYPVPPNYASKSKLLEGDVLKLSVGADGLFVYKQISPVERRRATGRLVVDEHGDFRVQTEEKAYRILLASVTFYKAEEGDEVTILLPKHGEAQWGAVENVIH